MTTKQTVVDEVKPESSLVLAPVQPVEITWNHDALKAYIDSQVSIYVGRVVGDNEIPQAKRERAAINALIKDVDSQRLSLTRRLEAPVAQFKADVKEILEPAKQVAAAIDVQVKDFEERQRQAKRDEIEKHWQEYGGILAEATPFEVIYNPEWLLTKFDLMTVFGIVEKIVEKAAKDEAALTKLDLPFADDAKTEFLATLDLSKAIARSEQLVEAAEARAKFDAEKAAILAEQEAAERARTAEAFADAPLNAVASPAPIAESMTAEYGPADSLEVEPNDPATPIIEMSDWTFVFHCTAEKAKAIADFATSIGVHGKAVRS